MCFLSQGIYQKKTERCHVGVFRSIFSLANLFMEYGVSQFSRSFVSDFVTPWTAACQASLSITNSQSSLRLIESVMPSSYLILCRPLLLLPSIFPSMRVFSNESALCIRCPKYWRFSFNISASNEHSGLSPLGLTGWISLQSKGLSRVFSNITPYLLLLGMC